MKINTFRTAFLVGLLGLLMPAASQAQQNLWTGGVGGNWTDATWNQFGPPDPTFDAEGVVGSTEGSGSAVGEVSVTSDISASNPSATVVLGDQAGTQGTLNITAAGNLSVPVAGISVGDVIVGRDGQGTLNVSSGTLTIGNDFRSNSGSGDSAINLSGTASVSAATGFLDRNLTINGANVDLSFSGGVILGLGGTHSWVIPAAGASTISVGGNADLGGTLRVEFPDGTPTVGTTWNLVDAATVDDNEPTTSAGFSFIDTSAVSGLGQGERFGTSTVADGSSVNGNFVQLELEQHPVLVVNRDTNEITIRNPGAVTSIDLDSYAVTSASGSLNDTNYTPIASNGWVNSNPSSTTLSELNPAGEASFAASSDTSLGTVWKRATPSAIGEENEDIRFRYSEPGGGFIEGDVVYTGLPNNTLTLVVDPTTGDTVLTNPTAFTATFDNYNVRSASGSLNTSWSSLEDNTDPEFDGWLETSNISSEFIAELFVNEGGLTLAPGESVNLGTLWNSTGSEDLSFTFALVTNSQGDFNGDGTVDLADYTVWRNNLGAVEDGTTLSGNGNGDSIVDSADYGLWKSNFGNTGAAGAPGLTAGKVLYEALALGQVAGGVSTAAVPEPSTCLLALMGLAAVLKLTRQPGGTA